MAVGAEQFGGSGVDVDGASHAGLGRLVDDDGAAGIVHHGDDLETGPLEIDPVPSKAGDLAATHPSDGAQTAHQAELAVGGEGMVEKRPKAIQVRRNDLVLCLGASWLLDVDHRVPGDQPAPARPLAGSVEKRERLVDRTLALSFDPHAAEKVLELGRSQALGDRRADCRDDPAVGQPSVPDKGRVASTLVVPEVVQELVEDAFEGQALRFLARQVAAVADLGHELGQRPAGVSLAAVERPEHTSGAAEPVGSRP